VTARYEDDYAFIQIADSNNPSALLAGGNNHVCEGLIKVNPTDAVKLSINSTKCFPKSETLLISPKESPHSCRKNSNYKNINCGSNCHLIQWPHIAYAIYTAPTAKENCANDCDENDCKAFSLQMDNEGQNGNRLCILYIKSKEPSLSSCASNPFNTSNCSSSTMDGQFFITFDAAKKYEVVGYKH